MLKDLHNEIVIKTKQGDFKVLKNGKMEDLPEGELMVRPDDLAVHTPTEVGRPIKQKPVARFYFSVDDEEDLNRLHKEADANKNSSIRDFIESMTERIINEAGLEDGGQLKNIIISRLREVRSLAETKEVLGRARGLGGSSLSREKIEIVVKLVEKYKQEVERAIRSGIVPASEDANRPIKPEPQKQQPEPIKQASKETIDVQKFEPKPKQEEEKVGQVHMTTGPVGEIQGLTLEEFRRLGKSADESAERVMSKINLLEDESLIKKAEGIKAWQNSEVGKLYIKIGAEAMMSGKSVEEVIKNREVAGNKYLTAEEFDAVADLNRGLSY